MFGRERGLFTLLITVLLLCLALTASAQGQPLVLGQPLVAQIAAAGTKVTFTYGIADVRSISLQALSETAQPTITILRDGQAVAAQPNAEGGSIVTLNALLNAGIYVVEVGAANNTVGTVVLVLQSETPVVVTPLALAVPVTGAVDATTTLAFYSFTSLGEPAFLYVESGLPNTSAAVRIVNTLTGQTSGSLASDMTGARFRIPAGAAFYQVEVSYGATSASEPFTLCWATVSAGGCEGGAAPQPATGACTVSPLYAGGANLRQSASTNAPAIAALPGGAMAQVLGISPDGFFYNVSYNGLIAWVALSAVTSSGSCVGLPLVNPPPIAATAVPLTAAPPVQTQEVQPPTPTATEAPTVAPPVQTQEVDAGSCLITMTGEALIYSQPSASSEYIFDEVDAGHELIPAGKLADNSWWKVGNAWIQTSLFGSVASVTGDCSGLPVISS